MAQSTGEVFQKLYHQQRVSMQLGIRRRLLGNEASSPNTNQEQSPKLPQARHLITQSYAPQVQNCPCAIERSQNAVSCGNLRFKCHRTGSFDDIQTWRASDKSLYIEINIPLHPVHQHPTVILADFWVCETINPGSQQSIITPIFAGLL